MSKVTFSIRIGDRVIAELDADEVLELRDVLNGLAVGPGAGQIEGLEVEETDFVEELSPLLSPAQFPWETIAYPDDYQQNVYGFT